MSIKRTIASMASGFGAASVCERLFQHSPRVIFFHGTTSKQIVDKMPQACQMHMEKFKTIILYLKSRGYNFISADDLFEAYQGNKQLTSRDLLITFDDGYRNNYTDAAPFLAKERIPFMVFVCSGLVDNNERISPYYLSATVFNKRINKLELPSLGQSHLLHNDGLRMQAYHWLFKILTTSPELVVRMMVDDFKAAIGEQELARLKELHNTEDMMSWDEVSDIRNYGCTIASHCVDHCVLHINQPDEEVRHQLADSKQMIESHIGECRYFSFPNGARASVSEKAEMMAKELFNLCYGVDSKYIHNYNSPSFVSRINACEDLSVFKSQLSILSLI